MSTSAAAGSTEQREERIGRICRSSLVEALSHRRSRRFALGGELKAGHTAYPSKHEPVPLSKEELATGLVMSDIDGNMGCSTQVRHPGLTTPSPCICPPYVTTMAEAVQAVQDSKYGNGRIFSPTNPVSPFRSQAEFSRGICDVPDEVVQCVKDLCDHVYEKYGRFPSNFDTISLPIWVGVHHLDLDFYAKFYRDEAITDKIRHHFQNWHGQP